MSTSLMDTAKTGLLTRAFVFAVWLSAATGLAAAAHATTTLPPLPDVVVFAQAFANDDDGAEVNGGPGFKNAMADGQFHGSKNHALALVGGRIRSEVSGGVAPVGFVSAFAVTEGEFTGSTDASAVATLNYWFRDTETAPFPKNLLGLPITLTFKGHASSTPMAGGQLWLLPPDGTALGGNTLLSSDGQGSRNVTLTLDASPNQIFQVEERATAIPDCVSRLPNCNASLSIVDPLITFDQQGFDALAAARGVPSVRSRNSLRLTSAPGLISSP
jgi:hypothetical protein